MKQKHKAGCIFRLGSTVCLASTLFASAQNLPGGTGSAEFQSICSSCHAVNIVTNQRMTRTEWAGVVNDMVSRGAQGSPEDLDKVVSYLAANFGKNGPSPSAPAQSAPSAPIADEKEAPLSEAEISRAKELVQANRCLSCHRIGDTGSFLAPELTDIGANRSVQQLRDSLVSPDKEVFYRNRLVQIITEDGKTLTGRLLNHDSYSVQFIESSGQLESVKKAGLREFLIMDQNPMPSYGDTMSADDLTILIRYLGSLRGSDAL